MNAARRWLVAWLDARLAHRVAPREPAELLRSTVVLSPHPDDEVLGCGGTIATLRRADVRVNVLFLTDGSGSHPALIARQRLAAIRRDEAVAACARLGVGAESVEFLDFPDGDLAAHETAAIARVADRLTVLAPERVLWPHPGDTTVDHAATRRIGRAALSRTAIAAEGLGFPIWFWCRWPWIALAGPGVRQRLRRLRGDLAQLRALGDLTVRVDLDPSAHQAKIDALAEHRSQTTRLIDDPRWQTLGDVAGGDYLARLLGPIEWFVEDVRRPS